MENFRIVLMNGGLGNQLYQYTFLRFLEITTGERCWIDDSAFWEEHVEHNGLELEKIFKVKLQKLSDCFTSDVWEEMMRQKAQGISIPQQLQNNGFTLMMIAENNTYQFEGNVIPVEADKITDEILKIFVRAKGNVYYCGYFVNIVYVNLMIGHLRQELQFPTIRETMERDTIHARYQELIGLTDSVAVHIRRGDILKCGRAFPLEKYAQGIQRFEERGKEYTYFIFSDDVEYCKQNQDKLGLDHSKGEYVFVEGNCGNGNNYIDMQLMSQCKNMIISNSSFGCWAYFLNTICTKENVIIIDHL